MYSFLILLNDIEYHRICMDCFHPSDHNSPLYFSGAAREGDVDLQTDDRNESLGCQTLVVAGDEDIILCIYTYIYIHIYIYIINIHL